MSYREEARNYLRKYMSTRNTEDFERAFVKYQSLIYSKADGEPMSGDFLNHGLLMDLHSQYYVNEAVRYYNEVINKDESARGEEYYQAHRALIILLSRNNRSHENIDRYKAMVKAEPDNWRAYQLLSKAYYWARQYDDAWLAMEAALKFEQESSELLSEAGEVLRALARYDEAIEYYDKSHALNHNDASSLFGKASMYQEMGKYAESIATWEKVIEWYDTHGFGEDEMKMPRAQIELIKKLM